jgi:hypothetical protein
MSQSPYLESGHGKVSRRRRRSQEEAGASKSKGADCSTLWTDQQVTYSSLGKRRQCTRHRSHGSTYNARKQEEALLHQIVGALARQ